MTVTMRTGWILAGVAVILFFAVLHAWVDGGREPLRTISEPLPVPEAAK